MVTKGNVLENPSVDQVYGLHVWSYYKYGMVQVLDGALMAGCDYFDVNIKGTGY